MRVDLAIKGEESRFDETLAAGPHPVRATQISEFFLQNNKTLKTSYFTSLFYYEPFVTDFGAMETAEDSEMLDYHVFHSYFPRRKIFFYPKMVILQSSRPFFAFHRSFLEFYFALVLRPYLTCARPFKFKVADAKLKLKAADESVVRHKEFFLSFLFSCKEDAGGPATKLFSFADQKFEVDFVRFDKYHMEQSAFDMLRQLFADKANIHKFVALYFHMLLERKTVIVHERPAQLLQLLFDLLRPL